MFCDVTSGSVNRSCTNSIPLAWHDRRCAFVFYRFLVRNFQVYYTVVLIGCIMVLAHPSVRAWVRLFHVDVSAAVPVFQRLFLVRGFGRWHAAVSRVQYNNVRLRLVISGVVVISRVVLSLLVTYKLFNDDTFHFHLYLPLVNLQQPQQHVKILCAALYGKPIAELRSVTCHMGSHSVTFHPTQVNVPHLNTSLQADLPTPKGWKAELTLVLFIYLFTDSHTSK